MSGQDIYNWLARKKWMTISSIAPVSGTKALYKKTFGKKLDLDDPKDFNQKIQYLKLNDYYRNPTITQCVDKVRVKDYVAGKGLGDIVPKLYAVYKDADSIDWDALPDSFAIKCNHGCGYNMLVEDKSRIDKKQVTKAFNRWVRENQWKWYIETQYKYVEKRIFVEELLPGNVRTVKFYCFNGEPKILYVSSCGEKGIEEQDKYLDFYDMDWNRLPDIKFEGHVPHLHELEKPDNFDDMVSISKVLSKDFPFVRVDLNWIEDKIYFGELTFVPTGGFLNIPQNRLDQMGEWLRL